MSDTPEADALRRFRAEGLNDEAVYDLARIAFDDLVASMPEHFDEEGKPHRFFRGPIATCHEPYFKGDTSK